MTIVSEYNFFDTVYLRSDRDQLPRIIKSVQAMPGGLINYELECANLTSWHYGGSIVKEKIDFSKPPALGVHKPITVETK